MDGWLIKGWIVWYYGEWVYKDERMNERMNGRADGWIDCLELSKWFMKTDRRIGY